MKRFRMAGRGRGVMTVALAVSIISTACGSALKEGADSRSLGSSLDEWPELETVAEATTPVHPDVKLAAQPVVRTSDGMATLTFEVANAGNDDVAIDDLIPYRNSVPQIRLYDPAGNVRYSPMAVDHDSDSGYCLCSSGSVTIPAGETRSLHATFADFPDEAESVRLQIHRFTPIADLPVEHAGEFDVAAGRPSPIESNDALQVVVESVARHPEGTLVTARYLNEGASEPVELDAFPRPAALSVASADGDAIFLTRSDGDDAMAATDLSGREDLLPRGESITVETLVAPLPDNVDSVVVRAPELRRTLPVPVTDEAQDPETFTIPPNLEDSRIRSLTSETVRFSSPMVPTEEPDLPQVSEIGPELPQIDITETLTSEAQPDWSIAVRGVVRGPGDNATLLLDMNRGDTISGWPDGVGVNGTRYNLGSVTIIDPEAGTSHGVYTSGNQAFSTSNGPSRNSTRQAYAVLSSLDAETDSVTVDVPAFGTVEDVPVVDGPVKPGGGDVRATMRVKDNDNLRMDILTVGHLGDGNGTLVRARLVNESDPSAVETTFAGEGSQDLCDLQLHDPATGNRYEPLSPCVATSWWSNLAQGEQLVYEVRFPDLPEGIASVVATAGGYFPSGPVTITDDDRPWYLALPAPADDPSGATYVASTGTADRGETTTRIDDTIEVVLETDVLFEFDSDELTSEAVQRITDLAGEIADTAQAGTVNITGYTDDLGADDYNQELSENRAEAVRAVLESAADRSDLDFEVQGRGSRDPVAPNEIDGQDNPDGRERNRRVEVVYEAS